MKVFHKDVSQCSEKEIRSEVTFQDRVAKLGLCPKILATDYRTFIDMEDLDEMCIADMYGDNFKAIPKNIIDDIYTIITRIYLECDIEYIDITPYNFIEKEGKVWIIDFGHARQVPKKYRFLQDMFTKKCLTEWNPDFR
jgi:tRNA A-37 threonylcarbamoyl transferase component Bud32